MLTLQRDKVGIRLIQIAMAYGVCYLLIPVQCRFVEFNDRFIIEGLGIVDDGADDIYPPCDWGPDDQQHFMVFNRWGTEVFSLPPGVPYRNDWDGAYQHGQPLVHGTYFVLLRLGDRQLGSYVDLRNDQ